MKRVSFFTGFVPALMFALLACPPSARAAKADKPEKPDKLPKAERNMKSERGERAGDPRPAAVTGAAAAPGSFESFRLIVDRNIFNPNRTPRSRATDETAPRVDQLALVGTMESEQGRVAFFDGTDAGYRKVLRVGETVAGFTVKDITATGVELASAERSFALRVNQQLRRTDGGEWRPGARESARPDAARANENGAPPMPAVPPNASDVVRRLMEQRQKQLRQ